MEMLEMSSWNTVACGTGQWCIPNASISRAFPSLTSSLQLVTLHLWHFYLRMWKVGLLGFVCAGVSFEGLEGNPDGVSSPHFHRIAYIPAMPHGSTFIIFNKKPLAAHQRSCYGMPTIFWDSDGSRGLFVICGYRTNFNFDSFYDLHTATGRTNTIVYIMYLILLLLPFRVQFSRLTDFCLNLNYCLLMLILLSIHLCTVKLSCHNKSKINI